ncbi:type II toxin-antitoxin system VapC family toxin [Chlorogloeopsis sp. ULAP01]|uniref:type II toxin-antitoxin system VapC family toxin n=1 Tax=Chlorogloeopsis sp. ULAP01 TaxID=3056483 RepID=UPI0025AADD09|nr:type II toxin-antitoxin system VapC family toxin [Chlorogloeopsis sp. ULAP01]MDM9384885.1 type II toxin-antitoxin system VapC family toxin [Chlorogloeopsis sp. ULAP01]
MSVSLKCVVDASVGIKKFIIDPLTPKVDLLFAHLSNPDARLYIPDLFYIECTNIAWKYIRAGLYDVTEAQANLADLKLLRLTTTPTDDLMLEALTISVTHGISAYDACYVALSQQKNAPLLTQDQRLVNKFRNTDFDIQLFSDFSILPLL